MGALVTLEEEEEPATDAEMAVVAMEVETEALAEEIEFGRCK